MELMVPVILLAAVMEFLDASIGMGYGEITILLLFMGFHPAEVVPAVLLTSAALSLTAGALHHWKENVDVSAGTRENRIMTLLTGFGIAGMLVGVNVAIHLPENLWSLYIGFLVIALGVLLVVMERKDVSFSWTRLKIMGAVAAFNKGISGGGYGPVLTSGQMLSGVESKHAVGITSVAEGVVSTIGVLMFIWLGGGQFFNTDLILNLLLGGLAATPFAVFAVSEIDAWYLRDAIGVASILLGVTYLANLLL